MELGVQNSNEVGMGSQDGAISIETMLCTAKPGPIPEPGNRIFPFPRASQIWGPPSLLFDWYYQGVRHLGNEADHSPLLQRLRMHGGYMRVYLKVSRLAAWSKNCK
jgi:hypothetical protein